MSNVVNTDIPFCGIRRKVGVMLISEGCLGQALQASQWGFWHCVDNKRQKTEVIVAESWDNHAMFSVVTLQLYVL